MSAPPPSGLKEIFGPEGWLSKVIPHFEFRSQQLTLAEHFNDILEGGGRLLAEVGTGAGKTFAYLVPSILSGKQTIISTGTKNLQEQLFWQDIPLLSELRPGLDAAYLKGRANYLCLFRLLEGRNMPFLQGNRESNFFNKLEKWSRRTDNGDRSEIEWLQDDEPLWNRYSAEEETCLGLKCLFLSDCFLYRARRRAASADLVIVNHHLLMAEAVSREGAIEFLPEAETLVIDEAHQLEDVATRHLGLQVYSGMMARVFGEAVSFFAESKRKADLKRARQGFDLLEELMGALPDEDGSYNFEGTVASPMINILSETVTLLSDLGTLMGRETTEKPEEILIGRLARRLAESLSFILRIEESDFIYWYEKRNRAVTFNASPVDVSERLPGILFDRFESVLLTSATLTISGSFSYIETRLGLSDIEEIVTDSPFDYNRQTVLFVPDDMPHTNSEEFPIEAARRIIPLLDLTDGQAFILCTSRRNLDIIYSILKAKTSFRVMRQGDAPRSKLLARFKEYRRSVLVATTSFWQGVDVPGAVLSGVIIDRLPFAPPDDPITEGRIRYLQERGGNPFFQYQLPSAVIMLKQGLGRLIRRRTDRGLLAVLDSRILDRSYGRVFLNSLPPVRVIRNEKELREAYLALQETNL